MNVPNVIVRPAMAEQRKILVFDEGEDVVIRIGNHDIRFHYSQALPFSVHVRMSAKKAKARAGDTSRHWSVVGDLVDLNAKHK